MGSIYGGYGRGSVNVRLGWCIGMNDEYVIKDCACGCNNAERWKGKVVWVVE